MALSLDESVDENLRKMAHTVLQRTRKHRLMPVGIHVMSPTGELLSKASVNTDHLMGNKSAAKYLRILEAGWKPKQR